MEGAQACQAVALCRHVGVEKVTQISQACAFSAYHTVKGGNHRAVACLVKAQLHAEILFSLQFYSVAFVVQGYHHTVAVDVGDDGGERQIGRFAVGKSEEADRLSVFEIMLCLVLFLPMHFDAVLVQRIVVRLSRLQRVPRFSSLYLPSDALRLSLLAERITLRLIFQLEKPLLLLKFKYGVGVTHLLLS